jgi:cytochrome c oxidase subunit 2
LLRWLLPVLFGLCLLLIAGCSVGNSSILDPQGPVALQESDLFWFILIVATIVFVLVESVLIYSVVRFRAKPDSPEPRQIHGNTKLEIWWTIVPSLILFLVLGLTVRTLFSIQEPADTGHTMYVNVYGHQWWWEFRYFNNETDALNNASANPVHANPTQDSPKPLVVTADQLVVPLGTTVHLNLISDNVIHSFWIPQLTGKTDVIPGHTNHMWFEASALGEYQGACAEFCGDQHAHMRFDVVVKNMSGANSFNNWMTAEEAPAYDPESTLPGGAGKLSCSNGDPLSVNAAVEGKYIFFCKTFGNNACISCHSVYGTNYGGIAANGVVGPNLTHFGSRDLIAGGVLQNCPGQQDCPTLAEWLTNPQSVKPGNDMPDLGLSPDQVKNLVAYLESLQ